jgi:hypothetical protein
LIVLAGEARPAAFDLAKSICVTMGQYFQVGVTSHCYFVTNLMCGIILQERRGLLPFCVTMCQYFQVGVMLHCYIVDVGHHLAGEARPAAVFFGQFDLRDHGSVLPGGCYVTLLHWFIITVWRQFAGEARPAAFDLAKSICVTLGQYLQVGIQLLRCYFVTLLMGFMILQERRGSLPLT